jgi:hypothetical protein
MPISREDQREQARMDTLVLLRRAAGALDEMPREDRTLEVEKIISEILYLWKKVRDLNLDWE